jgi:hypothetical protein
MEKITELLRRSWVGLLIGLLIGIILGLIVGWAVWPVSWQPSADDVAAVADSFTLNNDAALAKTRLQPLAKADQERIINDLIRDRTARGRTIEAERLNSLAQALNIQIKSPGAATPAPAGVATQPAGVPTPATPPTAGGLNNLMTGLLILLVVALVAAAGVIFYWRLLPAWKVQRASRQAPSAPAAPALGERLGAEPVAPAAARGFGRFIPSYTLGNDNYDTSYSLETPRGEFLGECGMGISETVGEGKPDKVTAFDIWLFDKAHVRTVTQILMSDYAFKDQGLRTKLATKGEAILSEKGKTVRLETQSLRIDAQIVELIYAPNPNLPPNSHFQKLIVEIVPSLKEDVAAR